MNTVGDTTEKRIDRMSAAWSTMLMSLGNTGPVKGFFDFLNQAMEGYTARLNAASQASTGKEMFLQLTPEQQQAYLNRFNQAGLGFTAEMPAQGGLPGLGGRREPDFRQTGALPGLRDSRAEAEASEAFYAAVFAEEQKRQQTPSLQDLLKGGRGPGQFVPVPPAAPVPPEFGGFGNLPPGIKTEADWNRFTESVRGFEKTLSAQVPGYIQNPKEVAFWDESLGSFRKLVGDSEAISLATKAIQENTTKIQGAFNVPAGGEALISFYAAQAGFVPNVGGGRAGTGTPSVSPLQYLMGGTQGPQLPGSSPTQTHRPYSIFGDFGSGDITRNLTTSRPSRFQTDPQFRRHNENSVQSASGTIVNNRITVMIDGQVVSSTLNRQMHMRNYGNNSVGGNPSSLLVE